MVHAADLYDLIGNSLWSIYSELCYNIIMYEHYVYIIVWLYQNHLLRCFHVDRVENTISAFVRPSETYLKYKGLFAILFPFAEIRWIWW